MATEDDEPGPGLITLINHYVTPFQVTCVAEQVYLHPHPNELTLRNHLPGRG